MPRSSCDICSKGGNVTTAGWQVTLCDPLWHVISRSGVVISITNAIFLPLPLYCTHSMNHNVLTASVPSVKTSQIQLL